METAPQLNIKPKEDQFKDVPFVNDKTHHGLKVLVKRLFKNIQLLSNQMDGRIPYVARTLDTILDGNKWAIKDLDDRFIYFNNGSFLLRYDTKLKQLISMDKDGEQINLIQGVSLADLKKK